MQIPMARRLRFAQGGLWGGFAPHESSYNAKHWFQGGGEAGMNPAALTAQLRAVPTTSGSKSQNRIVWPDHV